ncbi:MAG TPA: adenosylmethionine--8-amino-7-oxononanoate transaminase [Verrucomicrobiae bacterium]|jgi:adenosylmethionine-8-amino-7-oxononanoate aminotransferase|nr:adenosylmethionine--8-amino-7-oxononanoate transaminase [Verrucomicrobiae bacterium]
MPDFAKLDQRYVWHPFTQMRDWLKREPIVIESGDGAVLRDTRGREYLDANSSIWTNLHGHNHPKLNTAIKKQLGKVAHTSALGFANEPASLLAEKLIKAAALPNGVKISPADRKSKIVNRKLTKVFFSDDGSTAMEVALKLAYAYAHRTGRPNPKFLSLEGAYHGDTAGAVSLGHIDLFHKAYAGLLFKTDRVMSPYCYRCPFNRAKPECADARDYRRCKFECVDLVENKFARQKKRGNPYAAFVVEPLMQGAAGMIPQPQGWLRRVAEITRANKAQLIADEVMTGFGRTGVRNSALFASHQENVQPDFLALAKGMTGGYLPMAATLTTQAVFDAFLGEYSEFKTFFHGHSFTANQLGAAAANASLDLLQSESSVRARQQLQQTLEKELAALWTLPEVGDIRQVGLVAGIELVKNWRTREPFDLRERAGIRVCNALAQRGVLTRPIGNVIVVMPPYCTTKIQLKKIVGALAESISEALSH